MDLYDPNHIIDYDVDYQESALIKDKKEHDSWLLSNLGEPPYSFSWGSITSDYDKKSWSSPIIFSYKRE